MTRHSKTCDSGSVPFAQDVSGSFYEAGNETLFVRQTGTGRAVVLLHGLGDSSIGWQFVEPGLVKAGYCVTVWDALGAGDSSKPIGGDYTILAHANRLVSVFDRLGLERPVLVGHSLGGSVALLVARLVPARVGGLVLIDAAAYREGALGGRWFWETPWLAELVLAVLPYRAIVQYGLRQNFYKRGAVQSCIKSAYLRAARKEGALRALVAQERQVIPRDLDAWEQGHQHVSQPTLIIWGEEDRLLPVAQGRRLASAIGGATLTILSGVGHSPHLEAPDRVLELILPFLETGVCEGRP